MRWFAFVLVVGSVLVCNGAASGKGGHDASLCGADGCTPVTELAALRGLVSGGVSPVAEPVESGFYTVSFSTGEGPRREYYSVYYVPGANLVGANGSDPGQLVWLPLEGWLAADLREASAILRAFPAPTGWPFELKSPGRVAAASGRPGRDRGRRERPDALGRRRFCGHSRPDRLMLLGRRLPGTALDRPVGEARFQGRSV